MLYGIACDSDGSGGSSGAAGAIVTPKTTQRIRKAGIFPEVYLKQHAAPEAFEFTGNSSRLDRLELILTILDAYLSSGDPLRVRL